MTYEEHVERLETGLDSEGHSRQMHQDRPIVLELIKALAPHKDGLRRWSVMRTIRKERECSSREIGQKFEDEIERTFRRYCVDPGNTKTRACAPEDALFFRPKEKAGEVWALISPPASVAK
ncbi:MAG TPA: hypothetical protein VMS78_01995 [Rhizomicrobium sp.]|nr:hypothetical protein [Rhizomicrobium sp.]